MQPAQRSDVANPRPGLAQNQLAQIKLAQKQVAQKQKGRPSLNS